MLRIFALDIHHLLYGIEVVVEKGIDSVTHTA